MCPFPGTSLHRIRAPSSAYCGFDEKCSIFPYRLKMEASFSNMFKSDFNIISVYVKIHFVILCADFTTFVWLHSFKR